MNKLDDIRALIDPQGYMDSMQQGRQVLVGNLTRLLVDYDLTSSSPHVSDKDRIANLKNLHDAMMDVKWRIEEVDRRLTAASEGAMGASSNGKKR